MASWLHDGKTHVFGRRLCRDEDARGVPHRRTFDVMAPDQDRDELAADDAAPPDHHWLWVRLWRALARCRYG
ncbi:hypothetical protein GCM10028792_03280 [Salinisphaera aquimarina]